MLVAAAREWARCRLKWFGRSLSCAFCQNTKGGIRFRTTDPDPQAGAGGVAWESLRVLGDRASGAGGALSGWLGQGADRQKGLPPTPLLSTHGESVILDSCSLRRLRPGAPWPESESILEHVLRMVPFCP